MQPTRPERILNWIHNHDVRLFLYTTATIVITTWIGL